MRFVRWSTLLVLVPLAVVCDAPVEPLLVEGAERFDPPPVYRLWWSATQECSGRQGLLSRVRWYVVPGAHTLLVDGRHVQGYWTTPGNTIVLAESVALDGSLVRHEMLHALEGGADHEREAFVNRCGGVVDCNGQCATEVGSPPPPDPAVAHVQPDALEVDVAVTPATPTRAEYGGFFIAMVTARNPLPYPVVVDLPPPTDAGPSISFEQRIEYASGAITLNDRASDASVTRFAPGETKRRIYDFWMIDVPGSTSDGGLGPGTYRFYGAYGRHWAAAVPTVTLSTP